jgi:competence protein ComEC
MKVLKYPITIVLLFLAIGIIANDTFHFSGIITFVIVTVCAIAFGISYYISKKQLFQQPHFLISTCLLSFSIGLLIHWLNYAPNNSHHYSHYLHTDETPVIKGVISERLKPNDYFEKYYFEVKSVDQKAANGKILLSVPKDSVSKHITAGDILIIADTPQPINKSLNPYQFDYSVYMEKQNVFHQLKLEENYIKAGHEESFDYYVNSLRKSLINSFEIHNYSAEVKNIVNALLLGQRQDMDKETTNAYTNAGVIHILAISGLHFATLFVILNMLLHPLRRISKRGRLWQLLLVLGVLWTFAFITGLSASVVRSVVMFSFVGIGQYFNRSSNIFNSIAVSMLVLLLAKPNFLFDVGFQLSYAAVFAIVWLQPLYSRIRTSKYKAVNYLSDTVVISLVAQIGVLPLTLYYFNQFPLLFLLANILVIPLSTLILLIGILVLILNFTIPSVAVLVGQVLEFPYNCHEQVY